VTFDPSVLRYEDLLEQWFFKLHDPTTLNRQGNDAFASVVVWPETRGLSPNVY
jgi:peptide methionine sulfoxide reductase MsrA